MAVQLRNQESGRRRSGDGSQSRSLEVAVRASAAADEPSTGGSAPLGRGPQQKASGRGILTPEQQAAAYDERVRLSSELDKFVRGERLQSRVAQLLG